MSRTGFFGPGPERERESKVGRSRGETVTWLGGVRGCAFSLRGSDERCAGSFNTYDPMVTAMKNVVYISVLPWK